MNRFIPAALSIGLLLLMTLVAFTGGYLVTDLAVWGACFCAVFAVQINYDFCVDESVRIVIPFWEKLHDRDLLFQVNDPLLI